VRANHIRDEVQAILVDPYRNVKFGNGIYRGKREWRVNSDRILFVVCEQCRKLGHQKYNLCSDCENTPDKTVVFAVIVESHNY
jgi:hypothetical protein